MKEIKTNDGKKGGLLKGKPHYDKQGNSLGGIKAVVTDAGGKPVELEGGEVIINKEASKKHWKLLSKINQSAGGGVPIGPPSGADVDEDPEEFKEGGRIIEFNPNHLPNKWVVQYAEKIKKEHPEIWKLGGNIFGNEAFENLLRVSKRGHWLDSEEWMYVKWRSYVARHKGDFRIEGVVAMLKWCDKVEKGWAYMKDLIEEKIDKIESKQETQKMNDGGRIAKRYDGLMEEKYSLLNRLNQLSKMDSRYEKIEERINKISKQIVKIEKSNPKMGKGGGVEKQTTGNKILDKLGKLLKQTKGTIEITPNQVRSVNGKFAFSGPTTLFVKKTPSNDYYFLMTNKGTFRVDEKEVKNAEDLYDELESIIQAGKTKRAVECDLFGNPIMLKGGELAKGIRAEREHQKTIDKIYDRKVSKSKAPELIAKDHLKEDKKYYSKLEKMEGKKFGDGGSIENGMTLNELQKKFYYGKNFQFNDFPKYITHNGVTYEKGTFKTQSGLKRGQYILSYYTQFNRGTDFWRLENFIVEDKNDKIVKKFDTQAEMLKEYKAKSIEELDDVLYKQNESSIRILTTYFSEESEHDNQLEAWLYEYENKWVRGSGAEKVTFIEYIPLNDKVQTNEPTKNPQTSSNNTNDYEIGEEGDWNGRTKTRIKITKVTPKSVYYLDYSDNKEKFDTKEKFSRLFVSDKPKSQPEPTQTTTPITSEPKQAKFKVGDKVKLPTTKFGKEIKSNSSGVWSRAVEAGQTYLYVTDVEDDTLVLDTEMSTLGDFYSIEQDNLELYVEPTGLTTNGFKVGDILKWKENLQPLYNAKKGDKAKVIKVTPTGEQDLYVEWISTTTQNDGWYDSSMFVKSSEPAQTSSIQDTFGLKIGDDLPQEAILRWSEKGENSYNQAQKRWVSEESYFSSDRKIEGFKVIDGVLGFKVSGTYEDVYLRAEGFKDFLEQQTNKPTSTLEPTKSSSKYDDIIIENLEVYYETLGRDNYKNAVDLLNSVGKGWRLPTVDEFNKILYPNKSKLPGINEDDFYWTSIEHPVNNKLVYLVDFENGKVYSSGEKKDKYYILAVKDVKQQTEPTPEPIQTTTQQTTSTIQQKGLPSTDPKTWDGEFKVGDRVKVRWDFSNDLGNGNAKVNYFSKENDYTIISIDKRFAKPEPDGIIRPENPSGFLYKVKDGTWEGKDLELITTSQTTQEPQQTQQQKPTPKKQKQVEPKKRPFNADADYVKIFQEHLTKENKTVREISEKQLQQSIVNDFIIATKDVAGFDKEKLKQINSYFE